MKHERLKISNLLKEDDSILADMFGMDVKFVRAFLIDLQGRHKEIPNPNCNYFNARGECFCDKLKNK